MKRLITICLVLLLCASSAYARKTTQGDDSTAIAVVDGIVDTIAILESDILALAAMSGGNVFYVDNAATGSGTGADWTNAEITIELGLSNCTANAGDYIVCAPYHAETASTTTLDLDKDGVTVVGLGKGDAMTTITYDGTTDIVNMGANGDGCTIRNIKFYTATDNVAMAILVEDGCTDFIIEDCVFEATSSDEFLDAIYIDGTAANEGIIRRNRFLGDIASNTAPQSSIGFEDAHWLQIYDNEFSGDMGVAHIENKTTASNFITIRNNRFLCGYIGAAGTTLDTVPAITLVATTTGWIQDNFVVTNVVSPQDAIVAADCYCSNNYYAETQGASGSVLIGRSNSEGALAALGVSMTDAATRGRIVYVDSGETTTVEDGLSWATACDTLDEAVDLCTDGDGSTIFIAPGHTETMGAGADEVDIDVSGLTVIGLGTGDMRPLFDFTDDTTGAFAIGDDYVTIKNLRFHANVTAVNEAIEVEAGSVGVTIEGCMFDLESPGTDDFTECIDSSGTASDELHVIDCEFYMGAGTCNTAISIKDSDHCVIKGNISQGDYAVANINQITTASNHITIADNILLNGTIGGKTGLNAQPCIEVVSTTSGVISNNVCIADVGTPSLAIVAAHCYLSGNTYTEDPSTAGSVPISTQFSSDPFFNRSNYFIVEPGAFDTSGTWSTVAAHEIVAVTGAVRLRIMAVCTTTLTDGADAATLELGVAGNTACLIASTSAGGAGAANQLDTNEIWVDASPAELGATLTLGSTAAFIDCVVVGGLDVGYTIGGAALTGGVMVFHVWWEPLDSTGLCTAGEGGAF